MTKFFWKAYLWTVIILFLSLTPREHYPEIGIVNSDKFVHLIIYFIQSFLFINAFSKRTAVKNFKIYVYSLLICIIVGGITEILQSNIEIIQRKGDWLDFIFNTAGALLALISYKGLINSQYRLILKWL